MRVWEAVIETRLNPLFSFPEKAGSSIQSQVTQALKSSQACQQGNIIPLSPARAPLDSQLALRLPGQFLGSAHLD